MKPKDIEATIAEVSPDIDLRVIGPYFEFDHAQHDADLDELIKLAQLHRFDLFVFLRVLSEAGAGVDRCKIDHGATGVAGGRVVRCELSEGLKALLAALRARNLDADEVEGRPGGREPLPGRA